LLGNQNTTPKAVSVEMTIGDPAPNGFAANPKALSELIDRDHPGDPRRRCGWFGWMRAHAIGSRDGHSGPDRFGKLHFFGSFVLAERPPDLASSLAA
jgi:hypothetical protein